MGKKSASKIVQLVSAPSGLLTKGVEAAEGVEAVAAEHVLALGLLEDGTVVPVTKNDIDGDVSI